MKLTAKSIARLSKTPGRYTSSKNATLRVFPDLRNYWILRYRVAGKQGEMSLKCSYPDTGLDDANAKAQTLLGQIKGEAKIDPLAAKRAARIARAAADEAAAATPTFDEMARRYIELHKSEWKSAKHLQQWTVTLLGPKGNTASRGTPRQPDHCSHLREMPIDTIAKKDVLKVLDPIWKTNPETASRLRGRIEAVLDFAYVRLDLEDKLANPARWKGLLNKALPKTKKLTGGHHSALPYKDIPRFVARLHNRAHSLAGARGLEFIILTAGREGEVLGMTWSEVDFDERLWIVPASRMKAIVEHRVPLSNRALEIINAQRQETTSKYVFPSPWTTSKSMSRGPMVDLIKRMGVQTTVHGFRSSFRDWAGEVRRADDTVAEQCLAHAVGSSVRRAYARGDMLDRRRELMDAWSAYCGGDGGAEVIPLRAGQRSA
jgi:integrase